LSIRLKKFGKFKVLDDVYAYTSTRRLDKWGLGNFIYRYFKAYFLGKVFGKGEYERVD
jgi:hypothetical protein